LFAQQTNPIILDFCMKPKNWRDAGLLFWRITRVPDAAPSRLDDNGARSIEAIELPAISRRFKSPCPHSAITAF
jgi:hypothetical protein